MKLTAFGPLRFARRIQYLRLADRLSLPELFGLASSLTFIRIMRLFHCCALKALRKVRSIRLL